MDGHTGYTQCHNTCACMCVVLLQLCKIICKNCKAIKRHEWCCCEKKLLLGSTEWSKSLCAPDDYNTEVRCTETFWSPCIFSPSVPFTTSKVTPNVYKLLATVNFRFYDVMVYTARFPPPLTHIPEQHVSERRPKQSSNSPNSNAVTV